MVAACASGGPSADVAMCQAARSLSMAAGLVAQAAVKDAAGDNVGAQGLAGDAAMLAKQADDVLQGIISSDARQGDTWQALTLAYLRVGQAANALLPAYANTYGITDEELARGWQQLQAVRPRLPADCFPPISPAGSPLPSASGSG